MISPSIDLNAEHHKFFVGRRVALVGPSKTLIGRKQGRFIDDFDVIVRLNTAIEYFPFAPELTEDIGKRLDILYASVGHLRTWLKTTKYLSPFAKEGFPLAQVSNNSGVRAVIVANSNGNTNDEWLREWGEMMAPLPIWSVHNGISRWIRERLFSTPHKPTSGITAVVDIAMAKPAELHIFGMTFYNDFSNIFRKEEDGNMVNRDFFLGQDHNWDTELDAVRKFFNIGLVNIRADAVLANYLEGSS